jgi:predicted AlkP superfamily pyrophosphatase or phosphodiesterase
MSARQIASVLLGAAALSGSAPVEAQVPGPVKLAVVISIDQLRADYLRRFQPYFGPRGFNLFLKRGANFTEAHYQHSITHTCPGHAVILTGSYANRNGIVANSWYNEATRKSEYCAADTLARLIPATTEGRSPRNLLDSTVGDRLKSRTSGRSRVVAIAGKDRSAIMLGGHLADAAYWIEDTLTVTSTYYMRELPAWVTRFNTSGPVTKFRGATWDRILPAAAYASLGPDDVDAEENPAGMGRTFPHQLTTGRSSAASFVAGFETSPFENEVVVDFATEAVIQEQLGRDTVPDLLALGFSANDLVGHSFGPDSHEVMDMTVRTDRLLERFFGFLDRQIGLDSVIIVLTADHGVSPLPEVFRRQNPGTQAARFDVSVIGAAAELALRSRFGTPRRPSYLTRPSWIMYQGWPTLYLNRAGLEDRQIPVEDAERIAKQAVEKVPGVERAMTGSELRRQRRRGIHSRAELSFHPDRSGSIYFELAPYLLPGTQPAGTTHGSPWEYDTHVPMLWYGPGILPGTHTESVGVADIAPTLAALLGIPPVAGYAGRVLRELVP